MPWEQPALFVDLSAGESYEELNQLDEYRGSADVDEQGEVTMGCEVDDDRGQCQYQKEGT